MTDRELDQLFVAAREEALEIPPVHVEVMRRVRVRALRPWIAACALAAAASIALVMPRPTPVEWNVPLAATPAILAERVPLQRTLRVAVPKRAGARQPERQQMEIKLLTDDPDLVIIWLTEGDED